MKRNINPKIIVSIFSITFFIIIIFGSINVMIFNKSFYTNEYEKNGVYEQISGGEDYAIRAADDITSNIFDYFHWKSELKYFTDDEKSHMHDVKNLIGAMQIIYYISILIIIGLFIYSYKTYKNMSVSFIEILSKSMKYGSISAIIFLFIIFIIAVSGFDGFFTGFHQIFFPQGNWTFDSSSLLITLFPQQFFIDISLRIFIYALFQSAIFLGIGYYIGKKLIAYKNYYK